MDVKLNGDNYKVWATAPSAMIFHSLNLLSHVNGTPPMLASASSAASDDSSSSAPHSPSTTGGSWHLDDNRAMVIISQSLEPDVRMEVIHLEIAQEIWDQLQHMLSTLLMHNRVIDLSGSLPHLRSLWRQQDFLSISTCDGC